MHKLQPNEPKPEVLTTADPPGNLTPAEREVWQEIASALHRLGLLTEVDVATLSRYCNIRTKFREAKTFLDEHGFYYAIYHEQTPDEIKAGVKPRLKYMAQFPQVSIYMQLSKELTRLEQQFGMTPAARANLNVKRPSATDQAKARLYGGY